MAAPKIGEASLTILRVPRRSLRCKIHPPLLYECPTPSPGRTRARCRAYTGARSGALVQHRLDERAQRLRDDLVAFLVEMNVPAEVAAAAGRCEVRSQRRREIQIPHARLAEELAAHHARALDVQRSDAAVGREGAQHARSEERRVGK